MLHLPLFFCLVFVSQILCSHSNSYADTSGPTLRRHFPSLQASYSANKDSKLATNSHDASNAANSLVNSKPSIIDEDVMDDFEDPDFLVELHDPGKRHFDDYGHLRFGKRGQGPVSDDYGHMRFGKREPSDDYGHLRFGKRNTNNDNQEDDYGHLRFGR